MKVTFACSTSEIDKYRSNYELILNTIETLGHTVTRKWLGTAVKHTRNRKKFPVDWKEIFHEVSKSILACDVAVFECTVSSFSIGYQMSLALERRKPVLVLTHESSKRNLKDSFVSGLDSDLITLKTYNVETIRDILQDFFTANSGGGEKNRFNFFVGKDIENYLDWAAYTYKKTKSDLLREMISDKIEYGDTKYRKYKESVQKN